MEPTVNNKSSLVYISVIAALVGLSAYLYFGKTKAEQASASTSAALVTAKGEQDVLQNEYNATLMRLDNLSSKTKEMESAITAKDGEVAKLKEEITSILANKNATAKDLTKAKTLINTLNTKVISFEKQISILKKDNANLATQKEKLTADNQSLQTEKNQIATEKNKVIVEKENLQTQKKELEQKVDLAKVLHAGNVTITPIKKQFLTGKEVETAKSGRAKLMRINFNLDDNRLAETGVKDIYIVVYAPNGDAYNNGTFNMANGTAKAFTSKQAVPYTQGQKSTAINLDWKPTDNFTAGDYAVEIYHAGYKIGGNTVTLK